MPQWKALFCMRLLVRALELARAEPRAEPVPSRADDATCELGDDLPSSEPRQPLTPDP